MLFKMFEIIPLPSFQDNYIWVVKLKKSHNCVIVDPGDANVVLNFLKKYNFNLSDILITHHHYDHTGGIKELISIYSKSNLYIPYNYNNFLHKNIISTINKNSIFIKSLNKKFSIIKTPGHTLDHISYYTDYCLFSGDTLFSGGCGRIFEGTAKQMYLSLQKLLFLPNKTKIFCSHEYTLQNLEFALSLEPNNIDIYNYFYEIKKKRKKNIITLPSNIFLEKKINPFLRCQSKELKNSLKKINRDIKSSKEIDIFSLIRKLKDQF